MLEYTNDETIELHVGEKALLKVTELSGSEIQKDKVDGGMRGIKLLISRFSYVSTRYTTTDQDVRLDQGKS